MSTDERKHLFAQRKKKGKKKDNKYCHRLKRRRRDLFGGSFARLIVLLLLLLLLLRLLPTVARRQPPCNLSPLVFSVPPSLLRFIHGGGGFQFSRIMPINNSTGNKQWKNRPRRRFPNSPSLPLSVLLLFSFFVIFSRL